MSLEGLYEVLADRIERQKNTRVYQLVVWGENNAKHDITGLYKSPQKLIEAVMKNGSMSDDVESFALPSFNISKIDLSTSIGLEYCCDTLEKADFGIQVSIIFRDTDLYGTLRASYRIYVHKLVDDEFF